MSLRFLTPIHLFVADGRVHDDGVGGRRGSSERRARRVATAARGATAATGATATVGAAAILIAAGEKALHSASRHRSSFALR